MTLLNRDAILQANDRPTEEVAVPEWGGSVLVRGISGAERDALEASVRGSNGKMNMANVRARMCAMSLVDEAGARLFTDREAAALGEKSAAALDRVFDVALRLAGMKPADVDELTENFTSDPNGDSISD